MHRSGDWRASARLLHSDHRHHTRWWPTGSLRREGRHELVLIYHRLQTQKVLNIFKHRLHRLHRFLDNWFVWTSKSTEDSKVVFRAFCVFWCWDLLEHLKAQKKRKRCLCSFSFFSMLYIRDIRGIRVREKIELVFFDVALYFRPRIERIYLNYPNIVKPEGLIRLQAGVEPLQRCMQ